MSTIEERTLEGLLVNPVETMNVEYKSWLDLKTMHGKAVLAKAAIAIANHGGGVIVLGLREDDSEIATPESLARPDDIPRYGTDVINGAINRFADPQLQCEVQFSKHPETDIEHTFVRVPADTPIPVMSTRDSGDDIRKNVCYIRKPGPKSEPPYTSEEWRTLIRRCVLADKTDLLNSIRSIVTGETSGVPPEPAQQDMLLQFVDESRIRWRELISDLPEDDPARLSHGHFEFAFSLTGLTCPIGLRDLRDLFAERVRDTISYFRPFGRYSTDQDIMVNVDRTIMAWYGDPRLRMLSETPLDCAFWMANSDGRFYSLEGFFEDSFFDFTPGATFHVPAAIQGIGSFLQFSALMAQDLGADTDIVVAGSFTGLSNRGLLLETGWRSTGSSLVSHDNVAQFGPREVSISEIESHLVEIVHEILSPICERFSFYSLDSGIVAREIDKLGHGRWHGIP